MYNDLSTVPAVFNVSSSFSKIFAKQHIYSSGIDYSKLVPGGGKDTDIRSSHIVLYDDDVDYLLYADKRPNIWMQKQALELPGAIRMRDERSNMNKQAPKASNRRAVFEMPDDQVLQNSSFRVNMRDWRKGGNYHLCIATTFAPVTSPRRWSVQNNTLAGLKFLGDNVLPVIMYNEEDFGDICKGDYTIRCITNVELNPYGMPLMKSVFSILEGFTNDGITCDYFGYVNGDILLSPNIDRVLRLIHRHQLHGNIKKHVLIVGRRLNKEVFDRSVFRNVYEYNKFINTVYLNEPLYSSLALDYFIYNRGTYNLETMPPIVIGRGEIDAWQFNYCYENPDVDIIDTSDASRVSK